MSDLMVDMFMQEAKAGVETPPDLPAPVEKPPPPPVINKPTQEEGAFYPVYTVEARGEDGKVIVRNGDPMYFKSNDWEAVFKTGLTWLQSAWRNRKNVDIRYDEHHAPGRGNLVLVFEAYPKRLRLTKTA